MTPKVYTRTILEFQVLTGWATQLILWKAWFYLITNKCHPNVKINQWSKWCSILCFILLFLIVILNLWSHHYVLFFFYCSTHESNVVILVDFCGHSNTWQCHSENYMFLAQITLFHLSYHNEYWIGYQVYNWNWFYL